MNDPELQHPECFGNLDIVFPSGEEGIRTTPPKCMKCPLVKSCIQTAMRGPQGLRLQEERLDQAYAYGLIGTLERWSKKKLLRQQIEAMTSKTASKKKAE